MSNAAIYFHPDGYDTTGARLMGRHSAGESFLRGFLRHGDVDRFHFLNVTSRPAAEMDQMVHRVQPSAKQRMWHANRRGLAKVGVFNLPVPGLDQEAWIRRPIGDTAYALCGITHTTATATVMRTLSDFFLAPLHDFDALICTSRAVRASVEAQLDGVRDYLAQEYGPRRRAEAQRVTIPLGVNAADFATSPEQRKAWREKLEIPDDAIVALYVGRFDPRAKMNPALMGLALAEAAKRTSKPLYWVNAGWAATDEAAAGYESSARAYCPQVGYRQIDGRPAEVRFSIWSVADLFLSFSDNIQETFGLTPVEAMAAGLPCVVTDWDGYRDTVRHGEDGFRIPTYAPPPGAGGDLAYAFASGGLNYQNYVGAAGQFTAIDLTAAGQAIADLADNPDLRRRLGRQAKAQAQAAFDWSAIIPQYQALWAEQDARRRAAAPIAGDSHNPFRPDPFTLFGGYPTHHLAGEWGAAVPADVSWTDAEARLTSPLATYSNFRRLSLAEARQAYDWLAANPGASVGQLVAQFPASRRPFVQRSLLWMARFGALALTPQS